MAVGAWWLAGVLSAGADASVAVFPLTAEGGVSESAAHLVGNHVVDEVRAVRVFGRVVTMEEVGTVLGLEKQRQLMDCSAASCMAELSGALGVDYVLTGAVGRLGDALLLSLRLVRTRDAVGVASRSVRLPAGNDAVLLDAVPALVAGIIKDGGFSVVAAARSPASRETVAPEQAGGKRRWWPGAGVAGLGILGAAPLLAVLGAAVAVVVVPMLVHVPTPALNGDMRTALFPALSAALAALALVVGAAAAALVAAGVVMGMREP